MKKKWTLFWGIAAFLFLSAGFAATKWKASIPKDMENSELWRQLMTEMTDQQMYYGALSAAHRSLTFFVDQDTKEAAYRTIISLIDKGYPFPTKQLFVTGDLDL